MIQLQLTEKCDEPGCLNISQSNEWLPLLLLNQPPDLTMTLNYPCTLSACLA